MTWRSILISQPARLSLAHKALQIEQEQGKASVPLEDISVLVLEQPQVNLTAALLSALAQEQIVLLTVGQEHLPNGIFLPFLPHSRGLKVMRAQLALKSGLQNRLWQSIIKQKISNQADVLHHFGKYEVGKQLQAMLPRLRAGDPDNLEAQAAKAYFPALLGADFSRGQTRFYNAAMNYGYAVLRAALARTMCGYGLLPAFGLHHSSELNAFNLADDFIEPWRPLLDAYVLHAFPQEQEEGLTTLQKAKLVEFLHQDIALSGQLGRASSLVAIEHSVQSLVRILHEPAKAQSLQLPCWYKPQGKQDELFMS